MRVVAVGLSLNELQDALLEYCHKHGKGDSQPEVVFIESHGKVYIEVELRPGGLITADTFKHRSTVS